MRAILHRMKPADLITSSEASEILGRRIEPYHRRGRIRPAMRAGSGPRSPMLFARRDVIKLRDQIIDRLNEQLARVPHAEQPEQPDD